MLLEITIDSNCTELLAYGKSSLIIGCLNGTICLLDTSKRKLKYLVRTHNAKILQCVYQPFLKKLLTLSADNSIKLWNVRTKLEQIYEFRSEENPITKICSFHHKGEIICGFLNGQVKVFNLDKYTFHSHF